MKRLMLVAILMAAGCGVSAGQVEEGRQIDRWTLVAEGSVRIIGVGDMSVFVAPDSIRRNEDRVAAWVRVVMPGGSGFVRPGTNFGELRFHAVFTCSPNGRARANSMLMYGRHSEYLFGQDYDEDSGPELVRSVGNAWLDYLCERGDPTKKPPVLKLRQIAKN